MRKVNLVVVWVWVALVFCGLFVSVAIAADDPAMSGFYFEWRYADRGKACVVIEKTDESTLIRFHTNGYSKEQRGGDARTYAKPSEVAEIQKVLSAALAAYDKIKQPVKSTDKNIEIKGNSLVVTCDVHVSPVIFAVSSFETSNDPFGVSVPSSNLGIQMDLPTLEHYIKILPGLPAAVKLVDERIGAAVK